MRLRAIVLEKLIEITRASTILNNSLLCLQQNSRAPSHTPSRDCTLNDLSRLLARFHVILATQECERSSFTMRANEEMSCQSASAQNYHDASMKFKRVAHPAAVLNNHLD